MRWWLDPRNFIGGIRDARKILRGGGPRYVILAGIGQPDGWLIPTSEIRFKVEARDGTTVELTPHLPVPFSFAWAYRFAHRIGVPLVSDIDPNRIHFQVNVPGA
jgi:hypothetical protein